MADEAKRWVAVAAVLAASAAFSLGGEDGGPDGDVVTISMDAEGRVYWDGEVVDTNTLAGRLALLDGEDAIAFSGSVTGSVARAADRRMFETIARVGVPLVLVEDQGEADPGAGRPVTFSTPRIRQALNVYDKLAGHENRSQPLAGTDLVLRFDPDDQKGYLLKRVEVGLGGQTFWLVHELDNEVESSTSIQLKKEW